MTPTRGDRVRVFLSHPEVAGLDGQLGTEYPEFGGDVMRVLEFDEVGGNLLWLIDAREAPEEDESRLTCGGWMVRLEGPGWSRRLEPVTS